MLTNLNLIYETLSINPEPLVAPQRITIRHSYVGCGCQWFPLPTWISVGHHALMFDIVQDLIYYQVIHRFILI